MRKYSTYIELALIVVAGVCGVLVANGVGLLDIAGSGAMKAGLGAGAAYFFAASVWAALHR